VPDMTAGDDATQVYTDSGVINVGTIMTVSEVLEIGKGAARTVLMESWPFAEKLIDQRIGIILEQIIKKMQVKDETLLNRFKDPRFLGPLVSIERSFAETGDRELGGILSGLLADLADEPIRTRREIVLRESIECAPKLTTQHLNALTVILRITRVLHDLALGVDQLLSLLDSELRPYFGVIPADSFDYSYMGATQAGAFVRAIGSSVYGRIYTAHRNAMYDPIDANELGQMYSGSIEQMQSDLNEIVHMIEVPYEISGSQKFKLKTDQVKKILSADTKVIQSLTPAETKFREFLRSRSVNEQQFTALVRDKNPELAQFFDLIESTGALHFQLSPVGIMLARHEMENRSPEMAAQVDALFEDVSPDDAAAPRSDL
jgi:hypothetical protein